MTRFRTLLFPLVAVALFGLPMVAAAAEGEVDFRNRLDGCAGTSAAPPRLRCYDGLVRALSEWEAAGTFAAATEDEELLARGLKDCAGMGSERDRVRCYDYLVEMFVEEDTTGALTPDALVSAACQGERLCTAHGSVYFRLSPGANALDALLSSCGKIVGEAITACYRLGLEAFPNLGDADLTRGVRAGRSAAQLREMTAEALQRCGPRDRTCLKDAIDAIVGRPSS